MNNYLQAIIDAIYRDLDSGLSVDKVLEKYKDSLSTNDSMELYITENSDGKFNVILENKLSNWV